MVSDTKIYFALTSSNIDQIDASGSVVRRIVGYRTGEIEKAFKRTGCRVRTCIYLDRLINNTGFYVDWENANSKEVLDILLDLFEENETELLKDVFVKLRRASEKAPQSKAAPKRSEFRRIGDLPIRVNLREEATNKSQPEQVVETGYKIARAELSSMSNTGRPSREIDGKGRTVRELLAGRKYSIDYYQREYKWQQKQVAELVDDLANKFLESHEEGNGRSAVAEYGHYFLGSIIISDKDGEKFIIDGQQRLTTLTLLLIFLHHQLEDAEQRADCRPHLFTKVRQALFQFRRPRARGVHGGAL